jgi:predicted Rossmann fold nucleotide-binding protein DprA/Smf involved in DNA uptake
MERVSEYVALLPANSVVVSGNARGVDRTAEEAARERGLKVISLPAQWDKYGKSAGFRRNADIVKLADRVIAFWDGVSKGTLHTINLAKAQGKPVEIVRILK